MKNKMKILLIVIGLFIYQLQNFAQKPNYSGIWVLNLEKSKLESQPEGLTSSIFIIKQSGDKIKITRYHIFEKKKCKASFKMAADGKTRTMKLLFKGKLEWKENNLQFTMWRKNFSNIVNYKFGTTQNEFVADEVYTGNPSNHHNIWVFDKEISK
jgi:hypothetical protein